MRRLALAAAAVLPACASWRPDPAPGHEPTFGCTASKVLFPLNVLPDVAANTVLCLTYPLTVAPFAEEPSNLAGIIVLGAPFFGVVGGVKDAWHGYPFWDPVALDEHRRYRTCAPGTTAPPAE